MSLKSAIARILNEWPIEVKKPFKDNELAEFIRNEFAAEVLSVSSAANPSLLIKASAGAGTWASVPWLALLDPKVTTTTQRGIYPVYLFRADGSGVYLSLGQGTTEPNREFGKVEGEKQARSIANELRSRIPELSRWMGGKTDLRSNTHLGRSYEGPNIGARLYEKDALPDENVFRADLIEMLSVYKKVVSCDLSPSIVSNPEKDEVHLPLQKEAFSAAVLKYGLKLAEDLPSVICSSLHTKPFLILTGLSGSGKTQLAQAFSKWICASEDQRAVVAVGADWTSNENLLGYPDALKEKSYRKPDNGALDLILRAKDDQTNPYFLILDEMNLSHVERYFADFLSAMESGEAINLHDGDENELWDADSGGLKVPGKLKIPKNLFVIGTVNVDETTYMFSPKVLDRANVIEFRVSEEEMRSFLAHPVKPDLDAIAGQGVSYAKAFVAAAKQKEFSLDEQNQVSALLMKFFPELKEAGAEFGYRTAHEICRFVYFHKELSGEGWSLELAMDAAIMQKLLPKLHGARRKLEPILEKLDKLCGKDYPKSQEKIQRMLKRLREQGFTSFAEA
jgi:5-methylcytosine-specific restriction enzyme B